MSITLNIYFNNLFAFTPVCFGRLTLTMSEIGTGNTCPMASGGRGRRETLGPGRNIGSTCW